MQYRGQSSHQPRQKQPQATAEGLLRVRGLPTNNTARRMGRGVTGVTVWHGRAGTGEADERAIASSQVAMGVVRSASEGQSVTTPHPGFLEYLLMALRWTR